MAVSSDTGLLKLGGLESDLKGRFLRNVAHSIG
jgi:hypothetical protein